MLTPCRGLGAAVLEGILYVVGGSDGIAAINQVGKPFIIIGLCTCLLCVLLSRHSGPGFTDLLPLSLTHSLIKTFIQ